ncbi:MAG: PIN domain-containing protein, partial [Deltaproteobacteria bacterium]|nr:PIN domain-containing protein [Deltaproteobacteria bacterium]
YHNLCKKSLKLIKEPLITNWPVLTETMYLLNFSPVAQDLCLEFIESAWIIVRGGDSQEMPRIRQLMKQYKDLPIDFTDASIIVLAEVENIKTIFTLDHKDFRIYSPKHIKAFRLVPEHK